MKYINIALLFLSVVILNTCITLGIIDYTKPPNIKFAILDQARISKGLNDYLNNEHLDDLQRADVIKQYTNRLSHFLLMYESKTNTIVLNKKAVALPSQHDITDIILNNVKY